MYGLYKRLKNFTGVSADDNTGLIEMDSEWWDDREKEIQYAKKIRENGIPHMELMRHIFGRQGSKPEAMYSTHVQDAMYAEQNENEQLDKHVPEIHDNDGDDSNIIHKTDVHHDSQTISLDSPPRSPIGPSKRSNRKKNTFSVSSSLASLPKIWKLEETVVGTDLGFGKFQFDFETVEDMEGVLKNQPFHFDYWMLALARWQPKKSLLYPSEIPFGFESLSPVEFKTEATFESIGDAIGRTVTVDLDHSRVQVVVDAFKELCFETTIDFNGGEFYDGEEAPVSLRYEKLFGYCQVCGSLCHKGRRLSLDVKNTKKSPEKKREGREGNGVWHDGASTMIVQGVIKV
ncbi:unnamed protein product [Brassica napus]|uniref:(rape) hypothetical protein n=1 Tax=Brassica napus TaxID=3708 RepID=A0A816J3Z9_BRANA|nr:unnamed protein product [Brassica napus]